MTAQSPSLLRREGIVTGQTSPPPLPPSLLWPSADRVVKNTLEGNRDRRLPGPLNWLRMRAVVVATTRFVRTPRSGGPRDDAPAATSAHTACVSRALSLFRRAEGPRPQAIRRMTILAAGTQVVGTTRVHHHQGCGRGRWNVWVSRHRHARRAWEEGGERSGTKGGRSGAPARAGSRPLGSGRWQPSRRRCWLSSVDPPTSPLRGGVFASPIWLRAAGTAGGRRPPDERPPRTANRSLQPTVDGVTGGGLLGQPPPRLRRPPHPRRFPCGSRLVLAGRDCGPPPRGFARRPRLLVGSDASVPRFHSLQRPPPSTPPTCTPRTPSGDSPRTTHATRRGRSGGLVSFLCRRPGRLVGRGQAGASHPAAPHHPAPGYSPLPSPVSPNWRGVVACACARRSDQQPQPGAFLQADKGILPARAVRARALGMGVRGRGTPRVAPPAAPARLVNARCRTRPRVVRVAGGVGVTVVAGPPAGRASPHLTGQGCGGPQRAGDQRPPPPSCPFAAVPPPPTTLCRASPPNPEHRHPSPSLPRSSGARPSGPLSRRSVWRAPATALVGFAACRGGEGGERPAASQIETTR